MLYGYEPPTISGPPIFLDRSFKRPTTQRRENRLIFFRVGSLSPGTPAARDLIQSRIAACSESAQLLRARPLISFPLSLEANPVLVR